MSLVLIVDDNGDGCDVLGRLCRALGAEAECVYSGADALARLAVPPPPELVMLDLTMPEMDGFEVLERMIAMPGGRPCPVVLWTAVDDARSRHRALALGAADYWVKGTFDIKQFRERLARHLR